MIGIKDGNKMRAFDLAAEQRHKEVLEIPRERQADDNTKVKWMKIAQLHEAVHEGDEIAVKHVLSTWTDDTTPSPSLGVMLWKAAHAGNKTIAESLLAAGADVNTVRSRGSNERENIVLLEAAFGDRTNVSERLEPVKIILQYGAEIDQIYNDDHLIRSVYTDTVFGDAILSKNEIAIGILLDAGANINLPTFQGAPLYFATTRNDEAIAQLLLERGADVNKTGFPLDYSDTGSLVESENTCLDAAHARGYENMAQLLLNYSGVGTQEDQSL